MTGAIIKYLYLSLAMLAMSVPEVFSQDKPKNSLLLTGIVLDAEERKEMTFVHITIRNTFYGTATDVNGYFSIFVNPGDTLKFSYVGYEDAYFVMPYELRSKQYSLVQLMRKDTMMLETVTVFPWPDYKSFIKAFLDTNPPKNMNNLIVEVKQDVPKTLKEAEMNKYYLEQQRYQRLFIMHDIFPPNNLLDPSRWADFIRDLNTEDDDE